MDIFTVLKAANYPAMGRLIGSDPIDNLPCPVIDHKKQGSNYGPCRIMPPKTDDPGTLICQNCGSAWGAKRLAEELSVTQEVFDGRERYIAPREKKKAKPKPTTDPFNPHEVWIQALAAATQSRALHDYFVRRWRDERLAEEAVKHTGWLSRAKTQFFTRTKQHLLMVPLYDRNGVIVSGVKRYTGFGEPELKSVRFPSVSVGLEKGTPVWFGDPPPKASTYAAGSTLYIAEGEVDTLLLLAMRDAGYIEGGILGMPGGTGASKAWWNATLELLKEQPTSVVLAVDADSSGDKYWQRSAQNFPDATRVSLPDGYDLTDAVNRFGVREGCALINQAKRSHFRFYQLDSGECAYMAGDSWCVAKGRAPMLARLRASGYSDDDAKAVYTVLPPARDLIFDPRSTEPVILRGSNVYLNMFRGLHLQPRPGDCTVYLQLLYHICGKDHESYEHALDWLAKPLQGLYTGKGTYRNKTALVFYGEQGTGKGFMFGPDGIMRSIYGYTMTEIQQSQLQDKFDPRSLAHVLFLSANEVACSGYRDQQTLNRLKAWITEPMITVRRMNRAAEETRIWFNMVLMSNDEVPIRLESSDRRYSVFRQDEKLDPKLVAALVRERDGGWQGSAHFLQTLLEREIAGDMAIPFQNQARDVLLETSMPSQDQFAILIAEFGLRAVVQDFCDEADRKGRTGAYYNEVKGFIHTETLMEAYRFWCKQVGFKYPVRAPAVLAAVDKHIKGSVVGQRDMVGSRRLRGVGGLPIGEAKVELPKPAVPAQQTLIN